LAMRYTYVWEFRVEPRWRDDFERHYGPQGSWVALFRHAPGFIETLLLRGPADPRRYITIDRWVTESAYRDFRSRFAGAFAELDQRCERFTTEERPLGHFEELSD